MEPFDSEKYQNGFWTATHDICKYGVGAALNEIAANFQNDDWRSIGYRTAVTAYREGKNI
jgi:hypothetical protein